MFERKLTIGTHAYDQVRALADGSITIPKTTIRYETAPVVTEIFERLLVDEAFDVAELGFTYYLRALDSEDQRFIALPVFPARLFRHSAVYVNRSKVSGPGDLAGKRIGELAVYGHDAGIWAKGVLADEHGFEPSSAHWLVGGLDFPMKPVTYVPRRHPPGTRVDYAGEHDDLGDMLEKGEIDALISADVPRCILKGSPEVGTLFSDPEAVERDYHRRTGILPIMHVVVMRRDRARAEPELPMAVFDAFTASKKKAMQSFRAGRQFNHMDIMLPWLSSHYDRVRAEFPDDWWPYGVAANRAAIEAVLRYHHEQGITSRRLAVDEIFANGLEGR